MCCSVSQCVCLCFEAMKADRKRLKVEKADLANQMQQLYTTLESREEQLREFIRNYDQHRKVTLSRFVSVSVCLHSYPNCQYIFKKIIIIQPTREGILNYGYLTFCFLPK